MMTNSATASPASTSTTGAINTQTANTNINTSSGVSGSGGGGGGGGGGGSGSGSGNASSPLSSTQASQFTERQMKSKEFKNYTKHIDLLRIETVILRTILVLHTC